MSLCSRLFRHFSISIDPRIERSLEQSVQSVMQGAALSVTAIGRGYLGRIKQKHAIKKADRLIGNKTLHRHRDSYYQQVIRQFVTQDNPVICVDWSSVYDINYVILRAAIPIQGRAITLYEQVYSVDKQGAHEAHKSFLHSLASLLPDTCRPIICTDAGFKIPWAKLVERHNWYYLSRVRGTVYYTTDQGDKPSWQFISHAFSLAQYKATELQGCLLSKANSYPTRALLVKTKTQGRKKLTRKGRVTQCWDSARKAKSVREPWFLMTNLPKQMVSATHIVNLYKRRMTIEETFRDNKSEYYGLGLKRCRSRHIARIEIILLIGMLAQTLLYLIGKAAELKGYHRAFQANTARVRTLSFGFLALRILHYGEHAYPLSDDILTRAKQQLVHEAASV